MERIDYYRQCIRELLTEKSAKEADNPDIECLKRVYNCFVHLDIKEGKIWIQRNMTETDIAKELVEMGVSKEDIILGLHPSYKRPYTGYGVA